MKGWQVGLVILVVVAGLWWYSQQGSAPGAAGVSSVLGVAGSDPSLPGGSPKTALNETGSGPNAGITDWHPNAAVNRPLKVVAGATPNLPLGVGPFLAGLGGFDHPVDPAAVAAAQKTILAEGAALHANDPAPVKVTAANAHTVTISGIGHVNTGSGGQLGLAKNLATQAQKTIAIGSPIAIGMLPLAGVKSTNPVTVASINKLPSGTY